MRTSEDNEGDFNRLIPALLTGRRVFIPFTSIQQHHLRWMGDTDLLPLFTIKCLVKLGRRYSCGSINKTYFQHADGEGVDPLRDFVALYSFLLQQFGAIRNELRCGGKIDPFPLFV